MPLLKLDTSVPISEDKRSELVRSLSALTAKTLGKPESYVMVVLSQATVSMAGEVSPAAFVDVRSIGGLNPSVNGELSQKVCHLIGEELGISSNRVYINFSDVVRSNWGWDGKTF